MAKYLTSICLLLLSFPSSASTEIKTFIKEYGYRTRERIGRTQTGPHSTQGLKRLVLEEFGPTRRARHFTAILNKINTNKFMRRGK